MQNADGIDEGSLERLVAAFYTRVRADPELGPVFDAAIEDWPEHLGKLTAFWSSVMLRSGRYQGNPMEAHLRQLPRLSPALFGRWLSLWGETAAETMPREAADVISAKAASIADSLQYALRLKTVAPRARG